VQLGGVRLVIEDAVEEADEPVGVAGSGISAKADEKEAGEVVRNHLLYLSDDGKGQVGQGLCNGEHAMSGGEGKIGDGGVEAGRFGAA